MPATHQVAAWIIPLMMVPPAQPMKKYGIEHNAPNIKPNIPEKTLQNHTEVFFLNVSVSKTSNGHAYRYITHPRLKPYTAPSIRMKTGTVYNVFLPNVSV